MNTKTSKQYVTVHVVRQANAQLVEGNTDHRPGHALLSRVHAAQATRQDIVKAGQRALSSMNSKRATA